MVRQKVVTTAGEGVGVARRKRVTRRDQERGAARGRYANSAWAERNSNDREPGEWEREQERVTQAGAGTRAPAVLVVERAHSGIRLLIADFQIEPVRVSRWWLTSS